MKPRKIKPVVRYSITHRNWRYFGYIHLDPSLANVRKNWAHLLGGPGWRLVRIEITKIREVPRSRKGKR